MAVDSFTFFLVAGAPIVVAFLIAIIFRKPGVSIGALLLASSTLLLDAGRYLTPVGLKLFWGTILGWFVLILLISTS